MINVRWNLKRRSKGTGDLIWKARVREEVRNRKSLLTKNAI